jgi:hypothetical protein
MSFANALSNQLNILKKQESIPILPSKGTASFLFDVKSSNDVSNEDIYQLGIYGLINLSRKDFSLKEYSTSLFSSTSKYFNRETSLPDETKAIDDKVNSVLLHLSEHFLNSNCHKIIEFLLRIYKINIYNSEKLILSFLPYHSTTLFTKLIQSINFSQKHVTGGFGFMSHYAENGHVLLNQLFNNEVFKDFNLVYKIIDFYINNLLNNKDINNLENYSMFIVNMIFKCTEYYSKSLKGIKRKVNDINNFDIDNFLRLVTNFIVSICNNSQKITNSDFYRKFFELQLLLVSCFNLTNKFIDAMLNQLLFLSDKIVDNRKILKFEMDIDDEDQNEEENGTLFEDLMKTCLAILLEVQLKSNSIKEKNESIDVSFKAEYNNSLDNLLYENQEALVNLKIEYVKNFVELFQEKILKFSKCYDVYLLIREILFSLKDGRKILNKSFDNFDIEIIKLISDCNFNDIYMTKIYIISLIKELHSISEFIVDSRPHIKNNLFIKLYLKEELKDTEKILSSDNKLSKNLYNLIKKSVINVSHQSNDNQNPNENLEKNIINNIKNLFSDDYKTLSDSIKSFDNYIFSVKDFNKVLYVEIFIETLVFIILRSKNVNVGDEDNIDIVIDQKNVSIDISKKSTFNLLIEDIFKLKSFETIFSNNENFQNEICFLVFISVIKRLKQGKNKNQFSYNSDENLDLKNKVDTLFNLLRKSEKILEQNVFQISFCKMLLKNYEDGIKITFNDSEKWKDFILFSFKSSITYSVSLFEKNYFEEGVKNGMYETISNYLNFNKDEFYSSNNIITNIINHELKEAKAYGFDNINCNFPLSITDLVWESIELSKNNLLKISNNGVLKRFFNDDLAYYIFSKFFELCSLGEKKSKEIHRKGLNSLINLNMDETAFQNFLSYVILTDILTIKNESKASLLIDLITNPYSKSRINVYSASKFKTNIKVSHESNNTANNSKNTIKSTELMLILSLLYVLKSNNFTEKYKGFSDDNIENSNKIIYDFIKSIKMENVIFSSFNLNSILNVQDQLNRNKCRDVIKKDKISFIIESFFKYGKNYVIENVGTFYEIIDQICLKDLKNEDFIMTKVLENLSNLVKGNENGNNLNILLLDSIVSYQSFINLLELKNECSDNLFFNLIYPVCSDCISNIRNYSKETIKKYEDFTIQLIDKVKLYKVKCSGKFLEIVIRSLIEIYSFNKKQFSPELFVNISLFGTSNKDIYLDFNNFKFNINKEKIFNFLIENYDSKYQYKDLLITLEILNFNDKKLENMEKLLKFIENLINKSDEVTSSTNYENEDKQNENLVKGKQVKIKTKTNNNKNLSNMNKDKGIEDKYEEYSSLLMYLSNYLVIFSNLTISNNNKDQCNQLLVEIYNLSIKIMGKINKSNNSSNLDTNYIEDFILINTNILKSYEKISLIIFEHSSSGEFLINPKIDDLIHRFYEEIGKNSVSLIRNKITSSLFTHTVNLINLHTESFCLIKNKENGSLLRILTSLLHTHLKYFFKHLEKDINLYLYAIIKATFENFIKNNSTINDNDRYSDDFDSCLYKKMNHNVISCFIDSLLYLIEEFGQLKLYQPLLELFELEFDLCYKLDILKNQIDSTVKTILDKDSLQTTFGIKNLTIEIDELLQLKIKFIHNSYVKIEKEISKELQNKRKLNINNENENFNSQVDIIEQSPLYKLNFIFDSYKTLMLAVQNKKKEIILQCLTFEKYLFESIYNMNHFENILNFLVKNYKSENLSKFVSEDKLVQYLCQNFLNLIYSDESLKLNSIENRKKMFFTLTDFITNKDRIILFGNFNSIKISDVELLQLMISICSNICITENTNEDAILKIVSNIIILQKLIIKLINSSFNMKNDESLKDKRNSLIYLSMSILVFISKIFNVFQFKNDTSLNFTEVFDDYMKCFIEFLFEENFSVKEHQSEINNYLICTIEELSKNQSKWFHENLKELIVKMLFYNKNTHYIKTINSILLNCSKHCSFQNCYDALVAIMRKDSKENSLRKNSSILRVVVNFMAKVIHIADKKIVGNQYSAINKLFLLIFIILEDCDDELIIDQLLNSYSDFIMKINEKQFREIFEVIYTLGFKKSSENKNDKFNNNLTVSSIKCNFNLENTCLSLHLLSTILSTIKTFYFPYFERYHHALLTILQNVLEYFDSYNSFITSSLNKSKNASNRIEIVSDFKKTNYSNIITLNTAILNHIRLIYDNSKDKIIDYQFNETIATLIPNLLNLKLNEEFYEVYFNKSILATIISMFSEIKDDEVLCKFNENFLVLTKEGDYFTKYLVLKAI